MSLFPLGKEMMSQLKDTAQLLQSQRTSNFWMALLEVTMCSGDLSKTFPGTHCALKLYHSAQTERGCTSSPKGLQSGSVVQPQQTFMPRPLRPACRPAPPGNCPPLWNGGRQQGLGALSLTPGGTKPTSLAWAPHGVSLSRPCLCSVSGRGSFPTVI